MDTTTESVYSKTTTEAEKKEGVLIKGKNVIVLDAPEILPSPETPLLTNAKDIVGAINELKKLSSGEGGDEKYKSFSQCTDSKMVAMIANHYNNDININNYWKVGDTRSIKIYAITATENIEESYMEQDCTIRIIGIQHDDLTCSINGHDKAAVTLKIEDCIMPANWGGIYIWGKSVMLEDSQVWENNPRRTWLNENFKNSLPQYISGAIKKVRKLTKSSHTGTDMSITDDYAYLLSEYEVYGKFDSYHAAGYTSNVQEGEQYDYFKGNINVRRHNWLRSPSVSYYKSSGYYWCRTYTNEEASRAPGIFKSGGEAVMRIAPAFSL